MSASASTPQPLHLTRSNPHHSDGSARKRLVIVGGGFAGMGTLKHVLTQMSEQDNLDVVLVSDRNYFLYLPMLTEVTGGSVSPDSITTPLRDLCGERALFVQARVSKLDLPNKKLQLELPIDPAEATETSLNPNASPLKKMTRDLSYDYLVLAMGSITNKSFVLGATEHTLSLKDATDAIQIRNRVIEQFERAAVEPDATKRRAMLTFAIAGGGFSGIELAGSLQELIDGIRPHYPTLGQGEDSIVVVEGLNRILNELPEDLATHSLKVLRQHGVRVQLGLFMTGVSAEGVTLKDGSFIPAETVIWTTGVAMDPLLCSLDVPKDRRNRLEVNPQLELVQYPGVYVLGDCAMIPDLLKPQQPEGTAATNSPPNIPPSAPPTAQFAVREAKVAAYNVLSFHRGLSDKRTFKYKAKGEMAVIGHLEGVGVAMGIKLKGIFGWLGWRVFYLAMLPTWRNRFKVAFDWFMSMFTRPSTTRFAVLPHQAIETVTRARVAQELSAIDAKRTELNQSMAAGR